jgi:periplasmic divalent cation tolerance protein
MHRPERQTYPTETLNMTVDSQHAPDSVVCLVTTPQGNARSIALAVIEGRLAACVNIIASVQSIYWWQNKVERDEEALLVMKTVPAMVSPMNELLEKIHPYENFELIALDVGTGSHRYLEWIAGSVAPGPPASC